VTASPSVEDRERSLFNVDKNPYISPVTTSNIGMGRNAGNFLPVNSPPTQGVGEKNSGWGTAQDKHQSSVTIIG